MGLEPNLPGWLVSALEASWSQETSQDPARWSPSNPSWGQCAVTALVLQDVLGGELLRCSLVNGGTHYWNRLPSGAEVDLTRGQFPDGLAIEAGEVRPREYVLSFPETAQRYHLLKGRIRRQAGEDRQAIEGHCD
jgi:hypothetical protein